MAEAPHVPVDDENADRHGQHGEAGGKTLLEQVAKKSQPGAVASQAEVAEQAGLQRAAMQIDASHGLNGNRSPGDSGQTERREAEAAVDEPGVVDQVQQEGENQEVAEAFRVAAGVENRVMGLVYHEEDSAVEHRPHIGYRQLQICPAGAEQAEDGGMTSQPARVSNRPWRRPKLIVWAA